MHFGFLQHYPLIFILTFFIILLFIQNEKQLILDITHLHICLIRETEITVEEDFIALDLETCVCVYVCYVSLCVYVYVCVSI